MRSLKHAIRIFIERQQCNRGGGGRGPVSREKKPHTGRRRRGRLKEKKKKRLFRFVVAPEHFLFYM
jgi:hypothetical protein